MKYYSPLRYPGGKNKAVALFRDIIKVNELQGCVYVEPFAGGASVALALLMEGDAERIVINDADPSIYSFWISCLNHTDDFCQLMQQTEVTIDVWESQKDIYHKLRASALNGETYDTMKLGFAAFFLNRTNRSGILKGGIIGGHNQKGKYGITARFNKPELEQRIRNIAKYSERIQIFCEDAKVFLKNHSDKWPSKSLIYCDPPYVKQGRGLYMNFFKAEDHQELAKVILNMEDKHWIVTYDMNPLIANIYHDYLNKKLTLSYSASHERTELQSDEYIFFSRDLRIPNNDRITDITE
jgi:DNA adenine methylase